MLSIRIPYEIGRRLKAVCALRGRTVRDVVAEFAAEYTAHADELPPATAPTSVKLAALASAVAITDRREPRKGR